MILYHGSNMEVPHPKILEPTRALDFGAGFYTTSSETQAIRWAYLQTKRRKKGTPTVSRYSYDPDNLPEDLSVKHFPSADATWLNFVCENRKVSYSGQQYDIVIGPVANDDTMPVINDYLAGAISEETALVLLNPQKLADQYTFLSDKALEALNFLEAKTYD